MNPQVEAPQSISVGKDLSSLVITLLKGVLYREEDSSLWNGLLRLQSRVRDHVSVLGLELLVDEAEGYAFLRSKPEDENESATKLPRLIARRPLSFQVSLLLALLRKKLAEFDARGGDTRLVLSRTELVELLRVFLPDGCNQVKLVKDVDSYLNKVCDLGFLRRLAAASASQEDSFEVRRILKCFVDAQWLSDFDERLNQYQRKLAGEDNEGSND